MIFSPMTIEDLLEEATKDFDDIRMDLYHEFRKSLLTHIKMEENNPFSRSPKSKRRCSCSIGSIAKAGAGCYYFTDDSSSYQGIGKSNSLYFRKT